MHQGVGARKCSEYDAERAKLRIEFSNSGVLPERSYSWSNSRTSFQSKTSFRFKRKSRASDSNLRLSTRVGADYWSLMIDSMGSRVGERIVVCVKRETVRTTSEGHEVASLQLISDTTLLLAVMEWSPDGHRRYEIHSQAL